MIDTTQQQPGGYNVDRVSDSLGRIWFLLNAAAAAGVTVCYVRSRTFDDVKREWRVGGRDAEGFLLAERTFCADKGQNEDKSEDIADPYSPRRCTNDGSGSFPVYSIRLIERRATCILLY